MRLIYVAICCLCAAIVSCNSSQDNHSTETPRSKNTSEYDLKPGKEVSFLLDSNTSNQGKFSYFSTEDGKEQFLVFFNKPRKTIFFYDYTTLKEVNHITFPKQGPNSIPSMLDVQIVSKDSIFILSSYVNKMYLSDWNGKIYDEYSLLDREWKSEISFGFEMSKNIAYFQTMALANPASPKSFYDIKAGSSFDITSRKPTIELFSYPEIYKSGERWGAYHNIFFQTIGKNEELIVSFPLDPNLLILSNGKEAKQINCTSKYFNRQVDGISTNEDPNEYFVKQDAYDQIVYDKYRNVYYRIATAGQSEIPSDFSQLENPGMYKSVSIMILNDSFQVVGETMLPRNVYNHQAMFVSKDGLYIAKTHRSNPDLTENQIPMSLFVLTKLNK